MVACTGGYFGTLFKGYYGVTHVDPLSPTIFDVVVDAFLWHWVTVVESTEEAVDPITADTEVFVRDVQSLAAYFYADNRIIV